MKAKNLLKKAFLLLALVGGATSAWAAKPTISGITLPDAPTTALNLATQKDFTADANGWICFKPRVVPTVGKSYWTNNATNSNKRTWNVPSGTNAPFVGEDDNSNSNSYALQTGRVHAISFTGAEAFSVLASYASGKAVSVSLYTFNGETFTEVTGSPKTTTSSPQELYFSGLSTSTTYVAYFYGESGSANSDLYEVALKAPVKSVTSKVLTGININGSAWDISGLSDYAATITTAYNDVPEVNFVYTINYDDSSSDTGQTEDVTATKDGDNFVAVSTVLTNNVTLTFTNVAAKALPELEYAETAVAKYTTDASFTNPLTNPHSLALTYSVVAGATATGVEVNASTGEVSMGSVEGTATIKATFDGNEDYQAGYATYVLTVTKPTCATPTYTLGSYNYAKGGYKIVASCTTEDATLQYKIGNGDWIECTAGKAFYAKSGKLVIKASKDGYNDATISSSNQWTLNGAPSTTSPETLIPFQTSSDDGEKNKEHIYKSVTFGESNNASSVGGVSGSNGLKLRTNQTHGDYANSIKFYVHDGYKVTNITMTGNSNNTGAGATIDVNGMYVDGGDNTISSVEGNKTFPISSASAATFNTGTIEATDNIVLTFDNTNVSSGNKQLKVDIVVTYEVISVPAEIGTTGYATFSSEYPVNVDVTGLEAYVATGESGNYINMQQVTGNVAANTGLVLKGTPETTYYLPVKSSGTAYTQSSTPKNYLFVLDGSFDNVSIAGSGTNYVLSVQSGNVVWAPVTSVVAPAPAGHAALWIPVGGGLARAMRFNGITEVESIEAAPVATVKNGAYLENGKIAIYKNGMKFSATGARMK